MPKNSENLLIMAASEHDANLFYATRFLAPDDFCFLQIRGKKHLLMNDLEVDRAKSTAEVDQVHSLSKIAKAYQEKHGKRGTYLDLVCEFSEQENAKEFFVPSNFPLSFADPMRERGFKLEVRKNPFFPERVIKTKEEVTAVLQAIRYTETAIGEAIQALKKSVIKRGKLYLQGSLFTSERLKKIINVSLMQNDCIAANSIASCGIQCVDPHDQGSGPLYANQSIIMDIFPRHAGTRYYADISRTVVRGKASPKLKKMFAAVIEGQNYAFKNLRPGVDASVLHTNIQKRFEELGFKTGIQNGRIQGFFHGTGHGLGLDIHEEPRFGGVKEILKEGQIVTVEPGLYYEDAGGVRLEDDVLITKTGCTNLVKFPKVLEI